MASDRRKTNPGPVAFSRKGEVDSPTVGFSSREKPHPIPKKEKKKEMKGKLKDEKGFSLNKSVWEQPGAKGKFGAHLSLIPSVGFSSLECPRPGWAPLGQWKVSLDDL